MQEASLVRRVLSRLWQSEVSEVNPHFQADYRIAYIAVLLAARDVPNPVVNASYLVMGIHPSKVWPRIVARRKALLGKEYPLFYDERDNWRSEPLPDPWLSQSPRKPVQSVRLTPPEPEEDRAA
jgi:hypothetical protein